MKKLTNINAEKLAIGIQSILLDMRIKKGIKEPSYPVPEFERLIQEEKEVSKEDAELVTERILNIGIIRWDIIGNNFVL